MSDKALQRRFFFLLLLGTSILAFFIFRPYLTAVALAATFAVIFYPLYHRIETATRGRSSLAAFITTMLVLLIVFIPLLFFGFQFFREAQGLYSFISHTDAGLTQTLMGHIPSAIQDQIPSESVDFQQVARQALSWIVNNLGSAFSGIAKLLINLFLSLLTLFYLLRDGRKLKQKIVDLSPLYNSYDRKIFARLELTVNSVIRGSLVVAMVQGVVTGIGLFVFGVPNSALWGSVAAVAALIPSVGTATVLVPSIVYLFITSSLAKTIGLLLWGLFAVGLIDNFLGPHLIQHGIKIHPMLVLLSVIGGISFFGPIGFVIGPVVLSFFVALLDIYPSAIRRVTE